MKANDIRSKKFEDLLTELQNLKREQFNLRFQRASGHLENALRFRKIRRNISRIRTVMCDKSVTK